MTLNKIKPKTTQSKKTKRTYFSIKGNNFAITTKEEHKNIWDTL